MYIKNIKSTSILAFQCGKHVANYLIQNGLPLLSQEKERFYFADTELLQIKLKNIPFWINLFDKF